ncbi:glycerate kinase [Lentisphaera araneosa HTCC2155]|uniref:Glycerate kinase n=1 Tax=Lentisphaera araneosa HTCC2155 TaxID=313628 RepID=A6DKW9_9BACT|nr:glycerate kinase [Lentisphaera araneosa]EDM27571.1 glycerate kinase [Lentisphaera araneosa HTCC2155]
MRLVFAFDSFKGTIDARDLCEIAVKKFAEWEPTWECIPMPLADGGENTAEIIAGNLQGKISSMGQVQGPVKAMSCEGHYVELPGKRAVVEMAHCSGLAQLGLEGKEPLNSNTFGTGQVLRYLIDQGFEEILLTLGGSATNDGGTGAAAAMGWKFINNHGDEFVPNGGTLLNIVDIIAPQDFDSWPKISALCDVQNPMTGAQGAAYIFGPQKGANKDQILLIDEGLKHLAKLFSAQLSKDVEDLPGTGAAGAFGGGAMAMMNADLVPGIETILDWFKADEVLQAADYLITGEGCLDMTSFGGKVVGGVSQRYGAKSELGLAAIAGAVKINADFAKQKGLSYVGECRKADQSEVDAFSNAKQNYIDALEEFYRFLKS